MNKDTKNDRYVRLAIFGGDSDDAFNELWEAVKAEVPRIANRMTAILGGAPIELCFTAIENGVRDNGKHLHTCPIAHEQEKKQLKERR